MSILATQSESVRAGSETWQQLMKSAVRSVESLRECLELPADSSLGAQAVDQFPVFVPRPFMDRMAKGDINDPLLRQVLPVSAEDTSPVHYSLDPLAESEASPASGLLQKYAGRVLLIATGACAVHCRYCFRRHFPYQDSPKSLNQWQAAIDQINSDPTIEEVILSGGDPLTLVDEQLSRLIEGVKTAQHVKRLRIHTRLPIMIPHRVTSRLVEIVADNSFHSIMVIHSNHANELDETVKVALEKLATAGTTLLNQTVLLRGINDDAETLVELSKTLLDARVMPYYLHQLDPVIGASHFEVPKERGMRLMEALRANLPGYAVPRYVKELAGEPNKTVWS